MLISDLKPSALSALITCLVWSTGFVGCGTASDRDGAPVDADLSADTDVDTDRVPDADTTRDADLNGDADGEVDLDLDDQADVDPIEDSDLRFDSDTEMDASPDGDSEIDADEEAEGGIDADLDAGDDGDVGEDPPLEPLFSFVILADSHVTGSGENADRLTAAVDWINENAVDLQVEVVLVLGDIGWGGDIALARDLLDELEPPYVPIIGDNEVHAGDQEAFQSTFSDRFDLLEVEFEGWQRSEMPVWNPVTEEESWFANVAFDLDGVHFVGLDWAARDDSGLASETGDLHDFEGGTWRWFEEVFELLPKDASESIVLASHIPMHLFAFSAGEMATITSLLGPDGDSVYANFAGHVHLTYEMPVPAGGYRVFVTDATHDDENTLRVVHVEGNGLRFAYTHELIVVE